jgi:hypothetical protein
MKIPTDLIKEQLEKQGRSHEVDKVLNELPDKIDHEQHAQQLQRLGLDPGKLVADAARKGLSSL